MLVSDQGRGEAVTHERFAERFSTFLISAILDSPSAVAFVEEPAMVSRPFVDEKGYTAALMLGVVGIICARLGPAKAQSAASRRKTAGIAVSCRGDGPAPGGELGDGEETAFQMICQVSKPRVARAPNGPRGPSREIAQSPRYSTLQDPYDALLDSVACFCFSRSTISICARLLASSLRNPVLERTRLTTSCVSTRAR